MAIQIHSFPTMPTRPCRYCLSLQEGSVFLDLDVDKNDCLYIVRISYDGYGCCHADGEKKPKPLSIALSKRLIELIETGNLEQTEASDILSRYLEENKEVLWEDALRDHKLI